MSKIIGIDPGLNKTGWGVIDYVGNQLSYIACGTISTNAKDPLAKRLFKLHDELAEILTRYQLTQSAIEETFVNKNAQSSLKLGHARGALMLTLSQAGLGVAEYSATHVKKSVVGAGRAEKHQVEAMVKILLPKANINGADEADALAVAICHANHSGTYGGLVL